MSGSEPEQRSEGGGRAPISLDELACKEQARFELAEPATPEKMFERRWAEALLETVLGRLREEFGRAAQSDRFEILKPALVSEKCWSGAELATHLGLSES